MGIGGRKLADVVGAATLWVVAVSPAGAESKLSSLVGEWQVRIDGGGEIYSAVIEIESAGEKLTGEYRAEGRRGRVTSVVAERGQMVVSVQTQRSGMPAAGTFSFEIVDGRWVGDVDFESGTTIRSYEFSAERLGATPPPAAEPAPEPTPITLRFQNDREGYRGALDTEVWAIAPSKALDRQGTMTADGNNGGGESQVLMRFDGVFGDGPGQAPHGSRVVSAKLRIIVFDPGTTVYLHRLLVPWDASATWTNLAEGVSIDNVEASTVRDGFSFGEITMDKQAVEFDVTQSLQAWADGEPNHGWVFINTGGNGWDFYSSDWLEADLRPVLEVTWEPRRVSGGERATTVATGRPGAAK